MSRGNRLERVVYEFAEDPVRSRATAKTIVDGYAAPEAEPRTTADENEEETTFPEGRIIYRLHRARERNVELTRRKKASVMKSTGTLACEVCSFDFATAYGSLGQGFIECHHVRPLSELTQLRVTRLEDLALVCANCHRMLHRRRPWLSLGQLTALMA